MKFNLITLALLFSTLALAVPPRQVSVNVDGTMYSCVAGTGGGTDPACIKNLSGWCSSNTGNSSSSCFDTASKACKGAPAGYSDCVTQTAAYCSANTGSSSNDCFTKALSVCTNG